MAGLGIAFRNCRAAIFAAISKRAARMTALQLEGEEIGSRGRPAYELSGKHVSTLLGLL
jgi:hypothetical protein